MGRSRGSYILTSFGLRRRTLNSSLVPGSARSKSLMNELNAESMRSMKDSACASKLEDAIVCPSVVPSAVWANTIF